MPSDLDIVTAFYAKVQPAHIHPDVDWTLADGFIADGHYKGRQAVFEQWMPKLVAQVENWSAKPDHILDAGEAIVGLGHYSGRAKATGRSFRSPFMHVWWLEGGQIRRMSHNCNTLLLRRAFHDDAGQGTGIDSGGHTDALKNPSPAPLGTTNLRRIEDWYRLLGEDFVDEDAEWQLADGFPADGKYVGRRQIFDVWLPELLAQFDNWRAQPHTLLDAGPAVIGLGHYRGISKLTRREFAVPFAHVWWMRDGRIAKVGHNCNTLTMYRAITPA
jgi:uncharacterized protein